MPKTGPANENRFTGFFIQNTKELEADVRKNGYKLPPSNVKKSNKLKAIYKFGYVNAQYRQ